MPLPKKITPNPLVVTSIELRFTESLKGELFNSLYTEFIQTFPNIVFVNPAQSEIGKNTIQIVGLLMKEFIIKNEDYVFSVGRNSISMECDKEYPLWENYFPFVKEQFSKFCKIKEIRNISRIGVRYASLFGVPNIMDILKVTPSISLPGYEEHEFNIFRYSYKFKDYQLLLQLSNKAQVNKKNQISTGAVIDIDVSFTETFPYSEKVYDRIDEMHSIEKKLFFESLLKEDFIKTLNPEY